MIYKREKRWHLDVTVHGVRYRETLDTTDRRQALALEKARVSEIHAGRAASKSGREFARKPFAEAAKVYQEERKPHVSEQTTRFERERLKPLAKFFKDEPLMRFTAGEVAAYQKARLADGVSCRTVNMEFGVLRRMLKRAKVWRIISEDVRSLPENSQPSIARVLTADQKKQLFAAAATKPAWMVAYCAAVLAVSTTCRGVEIRNLRWRDVDLFTRVLTIRRSKTQAGHRTIPLNSDAIAALAKLLVRAHAIESAQPEHFVFPTCEHDRINPTRPQKSWRGAWRRIVQEAAKHAGNKAAEEAIKSGCDEQEARENAASPLRGFRFHDLRHQAITEMAEAGDSDATIMALAGHLSRAMLEHYSHIRMAAKRKAVERLESKLIDHVSAEVQLPSQPASKAVN